MVIPSCDRCGLIALRRAVFSGFRFIFHGFIDSFLHYHHPFIDRKGAEQRKHLITCLAYNMASVTLMYTQIAHYGTSLLIFVGQILANLLHTSIILLIAIVRFFTKKK